MRMSWVVLAALLPAASCKYLDQPKKTGALEKRVDELADVVSELTGKPVAQRAKAGHGDDHADKDKKDKKGAKGKKAKKGEGEGEGEHGDDEAGAAEDEAAADHGDGDGDHGDGDADHAADETDDEHGGVHARRGPEVPRRERGGDERDALDRLGEADEATGAHDKAADKAADKDKAKDDAHGKAGHGDAPHWSYGGPEGPAAWGKLDREFAACGKGKAQSPVDITPRKTDSELIMAYTASRGEVWDTGHALQVDLASAGFIVLDDVRYDLVQFHVHTPSEHTLAGEQFPMEVHLVHKSKTGKLAVIGVFYDVGGDGGVLGPVVKGGLPKAGQRRALKKFDPLALLPESTTSYRYDGSLTTPPCTEGVKWIVMKRSMSASKDTVGAINTRFGDNARPVQPLGDRRIR